MLQSKSPNMLLPSPARLGLSNAPSPPLPTNPNPNKPSPPPPSSSSSLYSSSSGALLSLLPPLPRAQSLLQQMASLSTSLFEVSPNRSLWSSSYRGNLPSFLNPTNSSSSIPSTPSSSSSTKEIITLFSSLQTQLFAAVAELQEILDLQNSIESLSRHISASDSTLLSFANKIREAEHVLDRLVDDYSHHHHHHSSTLDLDDLLSYAHRISYTTFAPPEHAAGLAPLRGALPPAPQDNEMRASQLYHFTDLDVGLPKKKPAAAASSSDSKEENASAAAAVDEVLMEPTPPREELPFQPPMLPITVPPGWKKGMPVDLPMDLPPVPPGWKPGDPVPLPPLALDGTLPGNRDEQKRLPIPPNAPEAIQVKYVQLDINPDEDEYSSDYSSEVGSSDEDDED